MTSRTIREFMWGFQPHFRGDARYFVNDALQNIGLPAAPEVLLIGFREAGEGPNPICVEPESGNYPSALLVGSMESAEKAFEARTDRNAFTSNPDLHERRIRVGRESARRRAIELALGQSPHGLTRHFFAGRPARVNDYRVYPVVSVLKSRWDPAPALHLGMFPLVRGSHEQSYPPSLQHAVIAVALGEMTLALSLSPEPQSLRTWTSDLVSETVRTAANLFVRGIVTSFGSAFGGDLFNSMNALSAQPYEGRTGVGTLLLGKSQSRHFAVDVDFKSEIRLSQTRALRKALEMTGKDLALITDGAVATALGHVQGRNETDGILEVTVTGRGQWTLGTTSQPLLSVDNGAAGLPQDRISKAAFLDTVDRVFSGAGDGEALWAITEQATEQQHGTMLVVHSAAAEEAERLAPQALAISPRQLDPTSLVSLTAIDGAILVAPNAECHAVGVILDGLAVAGLGDSSRGARYNSAVRYHQGADHGSTLIVIVSEDGMINLLPNLRRRVSRRAVEGAVAALVSSSADPVDFEQSAEKAAHVRSLAFYLSKEQTVRANDAFEVIEQARERSLRPGETGITRISFDELEPYSEMNDDYFAD
jgi:hypothetical protein